MSEKSNSDNKNNSPISRSSRSHSSGSCSCSSCRRARGESSNEPQNSEEKNLISGFITSLFDEEQEPDGNANPKEKETEKDFASSLLEEGTNEKKTKAVTNFVDSQSTKEKPNKKFNKNIPKTTNSRTFKKNERNINDNNILFSTKKSLQNTKEKITTKKAPELANKRNINNDLENNKHKIMKTAENNKKVNPKIKTIQKNKSKDISHITSIIKKVRKNNSVEKRIFERNDNKNNFKHLNRTLNYQNTEISEQYRAKLESDKEKKEYEERIKLMKNHISAMKRQEEDMNKKIKFLKHKEENINNVKKEKAIAKRAIMEYNINKKTELEQKRKYIEKQREIMNKGIKESNEKAKMDKINKYKKLQKERQEVNDKLNDINQNKNNDIKNKIEKIKALREYNKNIPMIRKKILNKNYNDMYEKKYEKNLERTELLKLEVKQLQNEEDILLTRLNKTRERLNTFNSTENIYFGSKRKNSEKLSFKISEDND